MKKEAFKQVYPVNAKAWRKWLEKNHDKLPGIWLVYYKKHTAKPSVTYNESVEEALCFGWIDSTKKRLDDERYMHQFTPRNLKSNWSKSNKKRVEILTLQSKMTNAGNRLVAYAKFNGVWEIEETPSPSYDFSEELFHVLKSNKKAFHFYSSLSSSLQKQYKYWVMSAKRPETRQRRFNEMIRLLEKEEKPGMK